MAEDAPAAPVVGGGGNGLNQQAVAPPAAAAALSPRRKAVKITILIILFLFIIFLASFNASMRHLIEVQKKGANKRKGNRIQEKLKHNNNNNNNAEEGLYKTTIRPLDGFLQKDKTRKRIKEEEDEEDDGSMIDNEKNVEYTLRPTVQSYNRQSQYHITPSSSTSTSTTAADAHYAKAIRLLSSPFDQLLNGGNAIPQKVYGGEYHGQSLDNNGDGSASSRGEGFVKVEEYRQRKQRGIGGNGRRRRRRQWKKTMDNNVQQQDDDGGVVVDEEEDTPFIHVFIHVAWEMTSEYVLDTIDWLYDILGVEMDHDEVVTTTATDMDHDRGNTMISRMSSSSRRKKNEEDVYSWRDTRVGRQLVWMYTKIVKSLWARETSSSSSLSGLMSSSSSRSTSSTTSSNQTTTGSSSFFLSKEDELAREGLYHLEKAADLGHAEAQRMLANSLASGILPISDHGLIRRIAAWQYAQQQQQDTESGDSSSSSSKVGGGNWTEILRQSSLLVPDDFSSGGEQLARAIVLWHISAMDGNVESAMALGYRHLYSATGGVSTSLTDVIDGRIATRYHPATGKGRDQHGSNPTSHYGVLGTCETALAYYEAAANGIMDSLEAGPTKGKVNPPLDEHRLAEIYMHGGASVSLEGHNKPDEIEEALQYYRMLASRNHSPEPDLGAAFTIANFYYLGLRGVKQQFGLALKYYEICGDYNHWEGGGQAGLMHFWGIGMSPEERDLHKAYKYFKQGTPGGFEGCTNRAKRRKKAQNKKDNSEKEVSLCDKHSINGMALMNLFGVEGLVERDVAKARSWWELCKDMGDSDCQYNYGMLRLGWMVTELKDLKSVERFAKDAKEPKMEEVFSGKIKTGEEISYMSYRKATTEGDLDPYTGPSATDYNVAIQEFSRAAAKGHLQAKHKLAMLYSTGVEIPKKEGKSSSAVTQSCTNALRYYKSIADGGETISRRNRAAWKQYNAGDYESSLRNYLATAETGSETGQVNAAFLLERGHCLGMTRDSCTRASVRLWRAAARQGNLEACLRVGDYYYYGRMKKARETTPPVVVEDGNSKFVEEKEELEGKAFYFVPGPYRWTRYILYPEEFFQLVKEWSAKFLKADHDDSLNDAEDVSGTQTCSENKASGICQAVEDDINEEDGEDHMAIAAQYYRKAAEEHKSARANFNLGFMHEWGLGLTQDFPLAKRHYDLAGEEASIASSIALWAMSAHQRMVKLTMMLNADYNAK